MSKIRLTQNQIVTDYLETLNADSDGFLTVGDAYELYPALIEIVESNSPSMDDSAGFLDFSSAIQTVDEDRNWFWSADSAEFVTQKANRSS